MGRFYMNIYKKQAKIVQVGGIRLTKAERMNLVGLNVKKGYAWME